MKYYLFIIYFYSQFLSTTIIIIIFFKNIVQVHCPQSCGYSINWNPYTRQTLHIDFPQYPFQDYVRFESNCYVITTQNNIEGANSSILLE